MATKTESVVSSDASNIDKCNDEVDPRVQVTFQLQCALNSTTVLKFVINLSNANCHK